MLKTSLFLDFKMSSDDMDFSPTRKKALKAMSKPINVSLFLLFKG